MVFLSLTEARTNRLKLARYSPSAACELSAESTRFFDQLPAGKNAISTHYYAAAGQTVIAVGVARWKNKTLILNNTTGHYKCPAETLHIAKLFWQKALDQLDLPEFRTRQVLLFDFRTPLTPLPQETIV